MVASRLLSDGTEGEKLLLPGDQEKLEAAVSAEAQAPDLVRGIRDLGALAAALVAGGSPGAARSIVELLERIGPRLEWGRYDAQEVAAALDDVGLHALPGPP